MNKLRILWILAVAATTAFAQSREHWVATWTAAPLETNIPAAAPAQAAPTPAPAKGAPATQPPKPAPLRSFDNQTIRMVVNTSIPGSSVRVELANTFGKGRLKIGAANIALRDKGSAIQPASNRALTFGGSASAMIPPGAVLLSDPVQLAVPATGDLVISVYLPEDSGPPTQHSTGLHTTYISGAGNFAGQADFTPERTTNSWYFLSGVHVLAPANTGVLVAYGDSITDGATSTVDTNADWPSVLARRLKDAGIKNLAVVNQGISGNRVVRDGTGVNALARFDRDVLSQPGVKYVVVMEGINDIGQGAREGAPPENAITAAELIAAYRQLIARAHQRGIQIVGATLTPYEGATYYSVAGEAIRAEVNNWIRSSKEFDAVFDFDAATRDPNNPKHIRADYTIRDNLHPNDAGYKAMADFIDLKIFK